MRFSRMLLVLGLFILFTLVGLVGFNGVLRIVSGLAFVALLVITYFVYRQSVPGDVFRENQPAPSRRGAPVPPPVVADRADKKEVRSSEIFEESTSSPPPPSPATDAPPGSPPKSQDTRDRSLDDLRRRALAEDQDIVFSDSGGAADGSSKEEVKSAEQAGEPIPNSQSLEDTSLDAQASKAVQFAAYYPKEVERVDWQPLHAYIFRQSVHHLVDADAQKQLGEQINAFRRTEETASQPIDEGTAITATPILPGFQFNPPNITIGFYKEWHRLDFELRAKDAPMNQAANGQLTFTAEGVIVADIPLSIFVGEAVQTGEPVAATQKIYEAIFASYSHKDTVIVERVERVCQSLGLDYLRDVTALKSGQHWSEELLEMIEHADIFQLFWSENAAMSDYVRREWQHALKTKPDKVDLGFIRPVYWRQPMPEPPEELKTLHFAYQPDLADD